MRSDGTTSTPKNKSLDIVAKSADKTSGKKLVQARLPFKIITPSSPISSDRNRRLYKNEDERDKSDSEHLENSSLDANEDILPKIMKTAVEDDGVVILDDDEMEPQSSTSSGSHSKVIVKLQFTKGSKRRKSMRASTQASNIADECVAQSESLDDLEELAKELNPEKRPRVETPEAPTTELEQNAIEIIDSDDSNAESTDNANLALEEPQNNDTLAKKSDEIDLVAFSSMEVESNTSEIVKTGSSEDEFTDAETNMENSISTSDAIPREIERAGELTPMEIKSNKQLGKKVPRNTSKKEQREFLKKQEREKREEQRNKEREERGELKRKDREEKERKRQAELEAKNKEKRKRTEVKEEELRKRTEAKEEELRKKEDERRRKEQEKEEADLKKKKAAEGFKKFFVAKKTRSRPMHDHHLTVNVDVDHVVKTLAFRPFQIRADMQLAPVCRKSLSTESKFLLDDILGASPLKKSGLYLSELSAGKIDPTAWKKSLPSKENEEEVSDDDVYIVDDLERIGQAIEETHAPVERVRAKFYKFHENRRPAFYGTWRKRTNIVLPRRPFAQDKQFLDYDIDSELDWEEEEEPGESLDGSDDEKEKESEDDEYEVDNEWFVPHGHLSDEELQNEDECGLDSNDREAQKAKLKLQQQEFAQEMKKKTEKLKPRLIGCIWVDENGNQPDLCPKIIWDTLNKRAMLITTAPPMGESEELIEQAEAASPNTNGTAEKLKPITLSNSMQRDLIRLLHGNSNSKSFLINEFIAYVEASESAIKSGQVRGPLKSMVREKIDEFAEWKAVETNDSPLRKRNKNKYKKRLCWIVTDDILKVMQLSELDTHNKWQYTLQPKSKATSNDKDQFAEAVDVVTANLLDEAADADDESDAKKTCVAMDTMPNLEVKRVALLMSVPRGQQFSMTTKNALISQFLTKKSAAKATGQAADVQVLE